MTSIDRWILHSPMSDPAHHAGLIAALPSDIAALTGIVQGLLIHSDWLTAYGLEEADYRAVSRNTLPVAERLDAILAADPRDLRTRRPTGRRAVGTCRDFALMLCAFLRSKGIAARVRCGFADYLGARWEDHWVCEYWNAEEARQWLLGDAQMDDVVAAKCRIAFDPTDVPRRAFLTAGEAWSACRDGTFASGRFGHGDTTGRWFIKINVIRDHYVLNGRETSAWDGWRAASASARIIREEEVALLDDIAARPLQPLVDIAPDWYG